MSAAMPRPLCRDDTQHGVDYYTAADLEAHAEARCAPLVEALSPFILCNSSEPFLTITARSADVTRARAALAAHKGEA